MEISTNKIASQLAAPYNTVHRAVMLFRHAILCAASDADTLFGGEIELDESYFGGRRRGTRSRGAAGKVPVFGILERQGIVRVDVVPDVRAETLLYLTVKSVRRGSIVDTDRGYSSASTSRTTCRLIASVYLPLTALILYLVPLKESDRS